MLRFYKGGITLEDIKSMSFARLNLFIDEIKKIVELEKEEKPLEGAAGFAVAKKIFGFEKKDIGHGAAR